jgi:hypothetical protein
VLRQILWSVVFLSLVCRPALALPDETWLVAIGNNRGDAWDGPLLYAERDARELSDVLRQHGKVRSDRVRVLLDEDAPTISRTLAEVRDAIRNSGAASARMAALVVYYSGHADAESMHLRDTQLQLEQLRELVLQAPAAVRVLIIDSCRSGTATRVKGLRAASDFTIDVATRLQSEGTAVLSSSTADETSQESDRLRGSFFSHHLLNALRGAADRNGDGQITLSETFEYTRTQTLRSSSQTRSLQHPTFAYHMKGRSDLILTTVGVPASGGSSIRLSSAGNYLITDGQESGPVVAEIVSLRDAARFALLPGRYVVQRRDAREYRLYKLQLSSAQEVMLDQLPYRVVAYDQLVRRRGGERRAVHGLTALVAARGEVQPGIGVMPNLLLGYGIDLPVLTVSARLRGGLSSWTSTDRGLSAQRYELGLSILLQRYVDLPWLTLSFGLSLEGFLAAERFDSALRTAPPRNSLVFDFAALLGLERRLHAGLSLRFEGGPVALLQRSATVRGGQVIGGELAAAVSYFIAGGVVWRR